MNWSHRWLYGRSYQINQMSTAKQTRKFSSTYHKRVEFSPDSLNGWFCHPVSPQGIIKNTTAIDAICEKNMNDTMWDCPWDIKDILESSGGTFFPGNLETVKHVMNDAVRIRFQNKSLYGKRLFFHPTVLFYAEAISLMSFLFLCIPYSRECYVQPQKTLISLQKRS